MTLFSAAGSLAAFLTTAAYVPQAYKTIKTRSTSSLSLPTYVMLFLGTCLWVVYGLHTGDVPVLASNVVTSLLAGIILCLKFRAKPTGPS
jgi:MtN3 and saliva related transmembrane protein